MGYNKTYYSKNQIDKLGNAIIYLTNNLGRKLYKTTLLKLIYLLEESSIEKFGIPFFNIDFKIWKLGPVFTELYYELNEGLDKFKPYFEVQSNDIGKYIISNVNFSDDEFSDNDIELMELVLENNKENYSDDLIEITHSEFKPWYIQASNEGLLDQNGNLRESITDKIIDFEIILDRESIQYQIFKSSTEAKRVFDSLI